MTETTTILAELSKPMAYKWRLKSVTNKARKPYPDGTRGQFLAYIDARDVFNRLDSVLGLANWQSQVKRINDDGSALVSLAVKVDGEWITREDVGYPNNPGAGIEEEPLKAAVSDAIKRAAVHFGIGRFLYDMPATWVPIDQNGNPTQPLSGAVANHDDPGETEARPAPRAPQPANGSAPARTVAPAPMVDDGAANEACRIEGCEGHCLGTWVAFSYRRYGVPLCSKHSAMAKRGELEDALAALNAHN